MSEDFYWNYRFIISQKLAQVFMCHKFPFLYARHCSATVCQPLKEDGKHQCITNSFMSGFIIYWPCVNVLNFMLCSRRTRNSALWLSHGRSFRLYLGQKSTYSSGPNLSDISSSGPYCQMSP